MTVPAELSLYCINRYDVGANKRRRLYSESDTAWL